MVKNSTRCLECGTDECPLHCIPLGDSMQLTLEADQYVAMAPAAADQYVSMASARSLDEYGRTNTQAANLNTHLQRQKGISRRIVCCGTISALVMALACIFLAGMFVVLVVALHNMEK